MAKTCTSQQIWQIEGENWLVGLPDEREASALCDFLSAGCTKQLPKILTMGNSGYFVFYRKENKLDILTLILDERPLPDVYWFPMFRPVTETGQRDHRYDDLPGGTIATICSISLDGWHRYLVINNWVVKPPLLYQSDMDPAIIDVTTTPAFRISAMKLGQSFVSTQPLLRGVTPSKLWQLGLMGW